MNKFATSSRESSLCLTPTPGSTSGQIPKFGTLIPNRVFVGGISSDTSENELKYFFSSYGAVKDCKIILDRGGISKSYGFVTFENQEDAERIIRKEGDSLIFKDRKLNVGPAIRKQQTFPKLCEPNLPQAAYIYQNGLYAVPNTMAVLCHPDGYVLSPQAQTSSYPVLMTPQSVGYYPSPPAGFAPTQWQSPNQWRWASQNMPNVPGIMPTAAGSLMYPMNITPDMMFAAQMSSSSGPATSSCQQTQERQEASTSVMEHAGECGNSLVQNMREQHFSKFTPPRNQHYMY